MNDLAFKKGFAGSMRYKEDGDLHKVIANHVDFRDDNGIAVYRTVDGIHDFETPMKGRTANTLLRSQYGIGTGEFKKDIILKDDNTLYTYVTNQTTANKNNLHQNKKIAS